MTQREPLAELFGCPVCRRRQTRAGNLAAEDLVRLKAYGEAVPLEDEQQFTVTITDPTSVGQGVTGYFSPE